MPIINISVKNKIAQSENNEFIVCNNSDYELLFDFDNEWEKYESKTATVTLSDGTYIAVLFEGNICKLPPLPNTTFCMIGVCATKQLENATMSISTSVSTVVNCFETQLDDEGNALPPDHDIYLQILAKLNSLEISGGGGTNVTVNGEVQTTWNADTKLDRITDVKGANWVYCINSAGQDVHRKVATNDSNIGSGVVPCYLANTASNYGVTDKGYSIATSEPINDYHATPKKYVDDGLSGKVDKLEPLSTAAVYTQETNGTIGLKRYSFGNYNPDGVLAQYEKPNKPYNEPVGVLKSGTPTTDWECTPKKYVDDNFVGKIEKTSKVLVYTNDNNDTDATTHYLANSTSYYQPYNIPMIYGASGGGSAPSNGYLITNTPKNDYHCANKTYVDEKFSSVSGGSGIEYFDWYTGSDNNPNLNDYNILSILIYVENMDTAGINNYVLPYCETSFEQLFQHLIYAWGLVQVSYRVENLNNQIEIEIYSPDNSVDTSILDCQVIGIYAIKK